MTAHAQRPTRFDPLPAQPTGRPWPTTAWPRLESGDAATFELDRLNGLLDRGFGDDPEPATSLNLAMVVVHRGQLVAERYGPDTTAESTLISWSMGKSVTEAMVGMLVGDGLLELDAPAPVPRWADDERSAITLRHLLTMTSGLEFAEDYVDGEVSDVIEMLFGSGQDDVAAYAETRPLIHPPGTVHNYSSGTTNIVAAICARALTSNPTQHRAVVEAYLTERLFHPLGMSSAVAKFDPAGTFIGSSFVYATAQDFARFGYLYLRDGCWDGARLLPEGWVAETRTPVTPPVEERFWYGSHWWLWDDTTGGFAAQGYEGQYVLVVPARDLVLVRLGKTDAERRDHVVGWMSEIVDCFAEAASPTS